MGAFELEEGFDNLKVSFADAEGNIPLGLDPLSDFTAQLDQVLKANNIERRQHDFSGSKPSGAPGGQGQQIMPGQ